MIFCLKTIRLFHSAFLTGSMAALFLLGIPQTLTAQIHQDTLLVRMESNPYYFNILKSKEGEVFAGTSQGIFKITHHLFEKVDSQEGYIAFDEKGKLVIQKEGIKNYVERKYLYLLPYPDQVREEFHVGTDLNFYIVSNGMLYSYDIVPYKLSFPNSSVRTISANFVGTYSGVFFKNEKLSTPGFTDGYIREFGGKVFLCYSDLIIRVLPEAGQPFQEEQQIIHSFDSQVQDVFYSSVDRRYYVATTYQLARLSQDLKNYEILYTADQGTIAFLGEMKNSIFFSSNDKLIKYLITLDSFEILYQHIKPILGGYTNVRNWYFLTEDGLHILNSDESYQKLTDLKAAHTVLPISSTENLIATNVGLWYFNATSRQLEVVIPGIEFNGKGLHKSGETIFAGSVKGLFTLSVNTIPQLIKLNQPLTAKSISDYSKEIIGGTILFLLIIGVLAREIIKGRQKIQYYEENLAKAEIFIDEQGTEPKVTREQIEEFIKAKLAEASLKSITSHFNITNSQVYSILKPDKPGTIIQDLRIEMVLDMKKKEIPFQEIANATGLSKSYVRKIKEE
jgi:DNA invertase Pin-like site-specific DNA recombinase